MQAVTINRLDGEIDTIIAYNIRDFPWSNCRATAIGDKNRNYRICVEYGTFDIESTTVANTEKPYAFMYYWQMTIGGKVLLGRTWEEWQTALEEIVKAYNVSEDKKYIIYVHNLGFEYQFIKSFIGSHEVFASEPRKPITVRCENGIEFRCSYKLTNMALDKAVKNELGVVHGKASGDLDYRIKRTPATPLTDTEVGYCVSDVVSLHELIYHKMKNEHDNLHTIPLTSTGYVRRDCRNATRKQKGYRDIFNRNKLTEEVYILLNEAKRGGNTHANRYLSGRLQQNVDSYDAVSSYPAQMMLRDYPCKAFEPYGDATTTELDSLLEQKTACLFRVGFTALRVRKEVTMPYIPISKCYGLSKSFTADNGRILTAEVAMLTITDIDWKIIKQQYEWQNVTISDLYTSQYAPLPDSIRGQIMEYFKRKCELKYEIADAKTQGNTEKVKELEYLYAKSKNRLNGIFGMCMTDPVRDIISVEDLEWHREKADLTESLKKYNNSRNSFLVYAWGIWVTAWARLHLETLFQAIGNGLIYGDTDSGKGIDINESAIDLLNQNIIKQCMARSAYYTTHGKTFYLGIFEKENDKPYPQFITLGAKKYCYTDADGLHVTVSGVNKTIGAKELKTIDNFKRGFIFKEAGGLTLYYIESPQHTITEDGCTFTTASNIAMCDSTYTLDITAEYAELINY